ncbi:Uncharacterized protein SCF082_LOCUS4981 [Durusdinium trenchii]|uniref:Uncharacterized protein n=1 Tax=Durusdinium trenchii TaxID=1381693 RepID=A0ABP0I2U1_9DINO
MAGQGRIRMTASNTEQQHYITAFQRALKIDAAQKESRIAVNVDADFAFGEQGTGFTSDFIGNSDPSEMDDRFGDLPEGDIEHRRRMGHFVAYDDGKRLGSNWDAARQATDPSNKKMVAMRRGLARKQDAVAYAAIIGTAYTGQTGTGTQTLPAAQKIAVSDHTYNSGGSGDAPLTVSKVLLAKEMLDAAEYDGPRFLACPAKQISHMLTDSQVTSADFNTVKALVAGEIDEWLGFKWLRYEPVSVDGSSDQLIAAWVGDYIEFRQRVLAPPDMWVRKDKRPHLYGYYQVDMAAVRTADDAVVQIACDPSRARKAGNSPASTQEKEAIMAVNDRYGQFVGTQTLNTTPQGNADVPYGASAPKVLFDRVDFTSGDSIGSKGYIARLPRHAVILPVSRIDFGAHGTSVTLNIGDANDEDGLASVVAIAAAGSADFLEAVAAENLGKPLWELLGYASEDDADELLTIYASIAGAATGATKSEAELATFLTIAQDAAAKLTTDSVESLDDPQNRFERLAAPIISSVFKETLEAAPAWPCARRRVNLTADTSSGSTPAFDYSYRFPLPSKFVRIVRLYDTGYRWVREGNYILSDDPGPIHLMYIHEIDPADADASLAACAAARLAWKLARAYTDDPGERRALREEYFEQLGEAVRIAGAQRQAVDKHESHELSHAGVVPSHGRRLTAVEQSQG